MRFKENLSKIIILLFDFFISNIIMICVIWLKGVFGNSNFFNIKPNSEFYFEKIWWVSIFLVFILFIRGLYSKRLPFWSEAKELFLSIFYAVLLAFTIIYVKQMIDFPRSILILYFFIMIFIFPLLRYYYKIFLNKMGIFRKNLLVVGAGVAGKTVSRGLLKEKGVGFNIIGFLDDFKKGEVEIGEHKFQVLGKVCDIEKIIKEKQIDAVVIAMPSIGKEKIAKLAARIQRYLRRLYIVPEMKGISLSNTELYHLFDEQLFIFKINNNLAYLRNRLFKHIFDFVLALLLLPFLCPVILILTILIKLDSDGPAFFVQDRLGVNGQLFRCIKFRSMYVNGDEMLEDFFKRNPDAREEWEKYKKIKGFDPRVTKMGRFLRKTSLDELPQIFNVLKGEMSFVGPRPYLPREKDDMKEYIDYILMTKPGITGLWQVSGRNELEFEDRLRLDTWYVLNWSLWLDIMILFKTVKVVLKREGAY